jgi:hypothetical protein
MRHPPAMPERPEPTPGEVAQFEADRDREADQVESTFLGALGTLGTPKIWGDVLSVVGPVALKAGRGLVRGLHPESPGGRKLTEKELRDIAKAAAQDLERRILREFTSRL